ncbi:zinc finger, CCHC-type containing protein [Tanacetum coccineum]
MVESDKNDNTSNSTTVRELGNVSLQCPKLTETNYTTWALMMETILKAYGIWETIVAKEGVTTNEKKENTSKAIIFQTLPQDVLMQVAQYSTAKEVWDSIKVKHLGADLVQKARLQTLRSELETLRIKPNEKVSDFGGRLSSIMAKFKGLGETLEDKVLVRKLLNSVPKKFLPIMATIEQYQDLGEMSFEEAVGRLTSYEERIKSQDTLEANDQDKLLMAISNNKKYGKWRGKDFNKEGKESMKWKNNPNARTTNTSQGTKDKSKLRCYECGEHGHFTKECTKWKYNKNKRDQVEKSSITRDFPIAKIACSLLKDSVSSSFCLPGWNKGRIVCQRAQLKKILSDVESLLGKDGIMNLSNVPIPIPDSKSYKARVKKGGMNNGEVKIGLNGGTKISRRTELVRGPI